MPRETVYMLFHFSPEGNISVFNVIQPGQFQSICILLDQNTHLLSNIPEIRFIHDVYDWWKDRPRHKDPIVIRISGELQASHEDAKQLVMQTRDVMFWTVDRKSAGLLASVHQDPRLDMEMRFDEETPIHVTLPY